MKLQRVLHDDGGGGGGGGGGGFNGGDVYGAVLKSSPFREK